MRFFQILFTTVSQGEAALPLILFLVSTLLLIAGLALRVWHSAYRLSPLEQKPLDWVEFTHPHIPSIRFILTFALSGLMLVLAALHTMQGVFPFVDPYQGLNIMTFFLLAISLGVLAEIRWKGAKDYASAVLCGSAAALLLLLFDSGSSALGPWRLPLIAAVLGSIVLTGYAFFDVRRPHLLLVAAASFAGWMVLSFLR